MKAGQLLARLDQIPLTHSRDSAIGQSGCAHCRQRLDPQRLSQRRPTAPGHLPPPKPLHWRPTSSGAARAHWPPPAPSPAVSSIPPAPSGIRPRRRYARPANSCQLETGYRRRKSPSPMPSWKGQSGARQCRAGAGPDASLTAPTTASSSAAPSRTAAWCRAGDRLQPLLTAPVWVRAYVEEPWLGHFPSGAKVTLTADSRPDQAPITGNWDLSRPPPSSLPNPWKRRDLRTQHLVYRLRIVVQDPRHRPCARMPVAVRLAP